MNIMINQLGYRPGTIKKAVFSGSSDADSFKVVNQDTKECVYSGALSDEKYYEDADENVKIADFTDFNTDGKYYIEDSLGNKSFTFDIKENIYDDALISSVKMFYLQRCGCELDKVSADIFSHKACHNTKARIYGTDEFIDVSGAWHDAGDYGRYVVAATKAILDLLFPAKEYIYNNYIYTSKCKLLLPIGYIHRFFEALFKRGRKNKNQLKSIVSNNDMAIKMADIKNELEI